MSMHAPAAWVEAHKSLKPGNATLQRALDDWMAAFEEEEERRRAAAAAAMEEEGWTVVARHKGRKKNVGGGGETVGGVASRAAEARAAGKGPAVFENFYSFQKRENRRNGEGCGLRGVCICKGAWVCMGGDLLSAPSHPMR
jgi:hypothetical protein